MLINSYILFNTFDINVDFLSTSFNIFIFFMYIY
jgi:hypothetical protein